jgi:hypothetical protein
MPSGWSTSRRVQGGLVRRWTNGVSAEVWPGSRHWTWCVFDAASTPLAHGLAADRERAEEEAEDVVERLIEDAWSESRAKG